MINILSYQQPLSGRTIKEWIIYHIENKTEYSKIANRMRKYLNIRNDKMYSIDLRPPTSACGEHRRYTPIIISATGKNR